MITPSSFSRAALGLILLVGLPTAACVDSPPAPASSSEPASAAAPSADATAETPYRRAAIAAARWIRSTAVEDALGQAWPADPSDTGTVVTNLYTGMAGVVPFFLELATATGDDAWLADARLGADYLLAALAKPESMGTGLYTGIAGVGFALTEAWKATGDEAYRDGALRCLEILAERAEPVGAGIEWIDSTDIISGSAGTGLFLLYAARELDRPDAVPLALDAGRRLLELARPEHGGLKWAMSSASDRLMPNFSHGTAGVAFFLARLYEVSQNREFLDAAVAGGHYLQEIATVEADACLVFHHEGDGEQLYYLSWCHGPAGTARTFYELWRLTGDDDWRLWVERLANGILESGIPEQRTPGFWNNVGQCCGSAGVAELFLALHRQHDSSVYLSFARRVADDMLGRATETEGGLMWVQAEHRVRPDFLVAQTGYMQGAAGIGMLLLHLDGALSGGVSRVLLPDSPFW